MLNSPLYFSAVFPSCHYILYLNITIKRIAVIQESSLKSAVKASEDILEYMLLRANLRQITPECNAQWKGIFQSLKLAWYLLDNGVRFGRVNSVWLCVAAETFSQAQLPLSVN